MGYKIKKIFIGENQVWPEVMPPTIEYLVVGGGAAGAGQGGGGGGEVLFGCNQLSGSTYAVTVGAGGIGFRASCGCACVSKSYGCPSTLIGDGLCVCARGGCPGVYASGYYKGGNSGTGCTGGNCGCSGAGGGGGGAGGNGTNGSGYCCGGNGGAGVCGYGGGGGGGGRCRLSGRGMGCDGGGSGGYGSTTSTGYGRNGDNYGGGGGGATEQCSARYAGCGCQGVVDICYACDGSRGINDASGGDCCYICNGICVHRFTSDGTFIVIN